MSHGRTTALGATEAGGSWSPLARATPVLWLDAGYGITTVSGSVSQWDSRVGGISVTQSVSGARPDYSATAWNSALPGVQFGVHGGSSAYTDMRSPDSTLANVWNQFTLLATVAYNADSAYQFLVTSDDGSGVPFGYGIDNANKERLDLHAGGADILGNVITTGNYRIWLGRDNATPKNKSYLNATSSLNELTDGADVTNPNTRTCIGGQAVLGAFKFHGVLAELIVYSGFYDFHAEYLAYSMKKWGG